MESKFQNRLVGTIVLTILWITILLGLLKCHKRHHCNRFTAVSLTSSKSNNDRDELNIISTAIQQNLPIQLSKNVIKEAPFGKISIPSLNLSHLEADGNSDINPIIQPMAMPFKITKKSKPIKNQKIKSQQRQLKVKSIVKFWIVQLGVLKNTEKVHEIVSNLHRAGYRVYTLPFKLIQDEVIRILVGLDTSKENLKESLDNLKEISGLSGVVVNYNVN